MQIPLTTYRGLYQPPGMPRINWYHPAAYALVNATLFRGTKTWDLTAKTVPTAIRANTPVSTKGAYGSYVSFNSSSMEIPGGKTYTGNFSMVAVFMRSISTAANMIPGIVYAGYAGSGGFNLIAGNGFDTAPNWDKVHAGTGAPGAIAAAWQDGVKQASPNPFDNVLANGVWTCAGVTVTNNNHNDNANWVYGWDPTNYAGAPLTGGIALCYVFSTILADSLMAGVTRDPYSMLIWPDDELMARDLVGSAALTFRSRSLMIA